MYFILDMELDEKIDFKSIRIVERVRHDNDFVRHYGLLSADAGLLNLITNAKTGSHATCYDTGEVYVYNESDTTWYKQDAEDGGTDTNYVWESI